jgi:hypothetical protein
MQCFPRNEKIFYFSLKPVRNMYFKYLKIIIMILGWKGTKQPRVQWSWANQGTSVYYYCFAKSRWDDIHISLFQLIESCKGMLFFQNPFPADNFSKNKTKVIPNKECIILTHNLLKLYISNLTLYTNLLVLNATTAI